MKRLFPSCIGVLSALTVSTLTLKAGSVAPGAFALGSFLISEEGGFSWKVDFKDLLRVNSDTGQVEWSGSPPDGWSIESVDVVGKGGSLQTVSAFKWHTTETVDPNASHSADNPWRSSVTFFAGGNVDPEISYAFSVKNNTGVTQNYSYVYGESVSPAAVGPYTINAWLSGGITNASHGSTTAVLAPLSGMVQTLELSTDGGTSFANAGVDLGNGVTLPIGTASATYGVFTSGTAGSFSTPVDYWQFSVNFSLSPGKDAVALTGYAEMVLIPEPEAYAGFLGLMVLGMALRRRGSWRRA